MLDMGVEPFLLVSSLTCVVGQRVLRKVCADCHTEVDIPADTNAEFIKTLGPIYDMIKDKWAKTNKPLKISSPVGCEKCNNTGYLGRVAIYEVMPMSEKIAKLVVEKAAASEIQRQAMSDGMLTMKQDGFVKVLEGVTTMEEVLRVAQY